MKIFYELRWISVAAFIVFFLQSIGKNVQGASPEQTLDASCKTAAMPAGFIAVGEIDSTECDPSLPGRKNAWLIDKVTDRTISCAPPDYAVDYPPSIALMVCDRVQSPTCPPRLDGTENAYLLAKGTSCSNSRISSFCMDSLAAKGQIPAQYRNTDYPFFVNSPMRAIELKFWTLSVTLRDPACSKEAFRNAKKEGDKGEFPDKINFLEVLPESEPLPVCSTWNREILTTLIPIHNSRYHTNIIPIIRMFYTDNCPDYAINGQAQKWNAFVVQRLDRKENFDRIAFMCKSSFKDEPTDLFKVVLFWHDDRCGSGVESNAYRVIVLR